MALSDTARGNANILSNRIKIDMSNEIALLKPREFPFTVLSKRMGTRPVMNPKFEWMEQSYMAAWTQINNSGGYLANATSIVVDDGSIIAVGDIIKIPRSAEQMLVTGVSTNTLTVTRGYGTTSAAAINDDDKVLIIGNAAMQGSGAPAEKYNSPTAVYNYTQIFKTPFAVTNTLDATELYGPAEYARLSSMKGIEHGRSIEQALLFGERKQDTSGAQPRNVTGGILQFIAGTANIGSTAASGSNDTVRAAINTWLKGLFTYGSGKKVWFVSPNILQRVSDIAMDKLQVIQADKDKTFGLDVVQWLTPFGMIDLILHPLFTDYYASYSLAVDMENIKWCPLKGRDTHLEQNIQNNDEDGRKDQYLTEGGLEIRLPLTHGSFMLT